MTEKWSDGAGTETRKGGGEKDRDREVEWRRGREGQRQKDGEEERRPKKGQRQRHKAEYILN